MGWKVHFYVVVIYCFIHYNEVVTRGNGVSNKINHRHHENLRNMINVEGENKRLAKVLSKVTKLLNEPKVEEEIETVENIVKTAYGEVLGHQLHKESQIWSFIDITYGKFEKMFQAPTEPDPWEHVHDVSEHKKICPQILNDTIVGDINCLVLSVFTPSKNVKNASVLFHIHGGNFTSGSGDFHNYKPKNLVEKGVILVLPNYRLGPLGFLCFQDEVAPGNAGLKDLTLALAWVKHNIAEFGGNPEDITVSAGGTAGALVGFLALSPMSNNLFNRAITESGSVLAPWALDRNPITTGMQLVNQLTKLTNQINKTEILLEEKISTILETALQENLIFKPCLEKGSKPFLDETPWSILRNKTFNKNIKFMLGSANKAGMHNALAHTNYSLGEFNEDFENLIPTDLKFRNNASAKCNAAHDIKTMYFGDINITTNNYENLTVYYTDAAYLSGVLRAARLLIDADATVYLYEFSYDGKFNREKLKLDGYLKGAARGDLIGYVFIDDNYILETAEDDLHMVKVMTDLWISFITTGTPTTEDISWNPLTSESETVLKIGSKLEEEIGVHPERMELWSQLYDNHFIEINAAFIYIPFHNMIMVMPLMLLFIKIIF